MILFSSDHQRSANRLACRHMERASVLEPESEPPATGHSQRTSIGDSKNGGGSSPSWVSKAASSKGSFAIVRAWLEHVEQEKTSASEAEDSAGVPSSHDNTANSTKASFASLRRPERDAHENDDRSEDGESSAQS